MRAATGAKTKTQAVHQALQDALDSIPERCPVSKTSSSSYEVVSPKLAQQI